MKHLTTVQLAQTRLHRCVHLRNTLGDDLTQQGEHLINLVTMVAVKDLRDAGLVGTANAILRGEMGCPRNQTNQS